MDSDEGCSACGNKMAERRATRARRAGWGASRPRSLWSITTAHPLDKSLPRSATRGRVLLRLLSRPSEKCKPLPSQDQRGRRPHRPQRLSRHVRVPAPGEPTGDERFPNLDDDGRLDLDFTVCGRPRVPRPSPRHRNLPRAGLRPSTAMACELDSPEVMAAHLVISSVA